MIICFVPDLGTEFHELLMRLIFLKKEHWSVVLVDFFLLLGGCILKGELYTSEKILKCKYFYNNPITIDEGECKMTLCESHR